MRRQLRIAVDIGGTFTDGIVEDAASGGIWVGKCLTTPDDPGRAVSTVIASMLEQIGPGAAADVGEVVHATTLVTNTVIERRGARTGLVLSAGTRDVCDIARELRYDLYDLDLELPVPLVPLEHRFELNERIGADGSTVQPIDSAELDRLVATLKGQNFDAIAVCFLHAYLKPEHEQQVVAVIRAALPDVLVSASAEIAAEPREYERMSTVAANAYVQPLMVRYLERLSGRLKDADIGGVLRIMLSSGGFTSVEAAAQNPIQLLESGPAAGVISATNTGADAGLRHVLAFDMGGTTAKACVVRDGEALVKHGFETARVRRFKKGSGLPILIPSIDLIEIGAGGGSIASINRVGTLAVGPESASSVPGPACYGLGGEDATVTDADLMLGYLNPDNFLGGEMKLHKAVAEQALARLGAKLGKSAAETAWGICSVVNEAMASAARVHIAEHGHDPRGFSMVATGGAGPVHAVDVARRLRLARVLCPIAVGAGSCLGLLAATARVDRAWAHRSLLRETDWGEVAAALGRLREDGLAELASGGAAESDVAWQVGVNMRYFGQGHDVEVQLPYAAFAGDAAALVEREFVAHYKRIYGLIVPDAPIEIVTWRLTGQPPRDRRSFTWAEPKGGAGNALIAHRPIYLPLAGGFAEAPVYDRYALEPGTHLVGPLILEERESTIVVAQPAKVSILQNLTVQIDLEAKGAS
jgi:N-methylhydantoinase A